MAFDFCLKCNPENSCQTLMAVALTKYWWWRCFCTGSVTPARRTRLLAAPTAMTAKCACYGEITIVCFLASVLASGTTATSWAACCSCGLASCTPLSWTQRCSSSYSRKASQYTASCCCLYPGLCSFQVKCSLTFNSCLFHKNILVTSLQLDSNFNLIFFPGCVFLCRSGLSARLRLRLHCRHVCRGLLASVCLLFLSSLLDVSRTDYQRVVLLSPALQSRAPG